MIKYLKGIGKVRELVFMVVHKEYGAWKKAFNNFLVTKLDS